MMENAEFGNELKSWLIWKVTVKHDDTIVFILCKRVLLINLNSSGMSSRQSLKLSNWDYELCIFTGNFTGRCLTKFPHFLRIVCMEVRLVHSFELDVLVHWFTQSVVYCFRADAIFRRRNIMHKWRSVWVIWQVGRRLVKRANFGSHEERVWLLVGNTGLGFTPPICKVLAIYTGIYNFDLWRDSSLHLKDLKVENFVR